MRQKNASLNLAGDDLGFMEAFAIFDTDGDGSINAKEYKSILRSINAPTNDAALEKDGFTSDNVDGHPYEKFKELLKEKLKARTREQQLIQAFDLFKHKDEDDTDESGAHVRLDELRYAISQLGDPLTDVEITEFLNDVQRTVNPDALTGEGDGCQSYRARQIVEKMLEDHV